jgi:hypothetical protein
MPKMGPALKAAHSNGQTVIAAVLQTWTAWMLLLLVLLVLLPHQQLAS